MLILPGIFALIFIILIHEAGHFLVAKFYKIGVPEFSIGFGRKLFSRKFGETTYCIRLLPLGGYVKLYGESEATAAEFKDKPDAWQLFYLRPASQRAAVIAAGPIFNFILAYVIFFGIVCVQLIQSDTSLLEVFSTTNNLIAYVWSALGTAVSAIISGDTSSVGGPVTIITTLSNVLQESFGDYLFVIAVMSFQIGVINLIPIPVLDGGHLAIIAFEKLTRAELSERVVLILNNLGAGCLVCLMIFAFYVDFLHFMK